MRLSWNVRSRESSGRRRARSPSFRVQRVNRDRCREIVGVVKPVDLQITRADRPPDVEILGYGLPIHAYAEPEGSRAVSEDAERIGTVDKMIRRAERGDEFARTVPASPFRGTRKFFAIPGGGDILNNRPRGRVVTGGRPEGSITINRTFMEENMPSPEPPTVDSRRTNRMMDETAALMVQNEALVGAGINRIPRMLGHAPGCNASQKRGLIATLKYGLTIPTFQGRLFP